MNKIQSIFQKILSFLRVRSIAGGLEVSDQVLRLVYFNGNTWQMAAQRLAPAILEKGRIKNIDAFIVSLRELKAKIPVSRDKNKKMSVVVSLSSVNIYSQVFTLPILDGGELESAISLNIQTLSPVDASETYSGWQMLGRDEVNLRLEISVAFIERILVDEMEQALFKAGFLTVGVESRALALVRILREKGAGVDINKSYLLLNIDNSGMDFLIVRNGHLYFEYTNQWMDIADEKGQISTEKFEETLSASIKQVTNFYNQHWPEPLAAVILSAAAFKEQAEKAINTAGSIPIINLTLVMEQPISSEWLVALGCSLRGFNANIHDKEVNLAGESATNTFRKEQLLHFISFWRVLVPVVLSLIIIMFVLTDNFLMITKQGIESQSSFSQQQGSLAQISALQASSTAFNQSIAVIQHIEAQQAPKYPVIAVLNGHALANGVQINHISFQGAGTALLLSGIAQTEDQVIALKAAIASDPYFGPVDLPLSGIQLVNGAYSFSMTFTVSPAAFTH
jgi:hypothetical protein